MTDQEILSAAVTASGHTVRGFAVEVIDLDERKAFRILKGEAALSGTARVICRAIIARPELAAELAQVLREAGPVKT